MSEDKPTVLIPQAPILPDPEPPIIQVIFNYEQLKEYRLQSQPFIVRVQRMLEDGFLEKHERAYLEWLEWIEASM